VVAWSEDSVAVNVVPSSGRSPAQSIGRIRLFELSNCLDYSSRVAVVQRGVISMDCADSRSLAEFWTAMLGGEVMFTNGPNVVIRSDWVWLCMMQVDDYRSPTWPENEVPKQIHLDLAVDQLESSVTEALRLGARQARTQPNPDQWRVMLDPAGHPFCLTTLVPAEVR